MVHCYGGRSRSAAFIAAFLMSSYGWSYHTAIQRIQTVRSVAHINKGFEIQLKAYAHANYDVYIAQQVLLQGRVRAVQSYRSIEGDSADDLIVKATERKKFGSLHPVGSNGNTSSRRHSNSAAHPPGSKRSWGNAKDDDTLSSSSEDAEEEDNLMESALKPSPSNSPPLSERGTGTSPPYSHHGAHYLLARNPPLTSSEGHSYSTNSSRLRLQAPLMDPRSPRLRLSRPGSTSVRVIPPLRGLERVFCCVWCHSHLFNLASVIRTDVRVQPLPELSEANLFASLKHESEHLDSYTSNSVFPLASPRGAKQGHQEQESTYLMPAPSPRGSNLSFIHSYPSDAKISTPPILSNKSVGSGHGNHVNSFKSPPKTMRSKTTKAFDFDFTEPTTTLHSSPRTRITSIHEVEGGVPVRVTSPMEISDEKIIPIQECKQESFAMKDERSPLHDQPPLSSRRINSSFTIQSNCEPSDETVNDGCLSRPTSSYHSKYGHSHLTSETPAAAAVESPRIAFPHGCRDSFAYPSPRNRPQSAEKRRWLARVNLLKSGLGDDHDIDDFSPSASEMTEISESFRHAVATPLSSLTSTGHDAKVAKLSRDDDEAIKLGFGQEKYIHLEYLEWMGEELLSSSVETGELKCGNCRSTIGSWTWNPTSRYSRNSPILVLT